MDSSPWPERRPRHHVELRANVIQSAGKVTPTIITNLSPEGCKIAGAFPIGEHVILEAVELGRMEGQIRWSLNDESGFRFAQRIEDQSVLSKIR
jgi:hypothetical protein